MSKTFILNVRKFSDILRIHKVCFIEKVMGHIHYIFNISIPAKIDKTFI